MELLSQLGCDFLPLLTVFLQILHLPWKGTVPDHQHRLVSFCVHTGHTQDTHTGACTGTISWHSVLFGVKILRAHISYHSDSYPGKTFAPKPGPHRHGSVSLQVKRARFEGFENDMTQNLDLFLIIYLKLSSKATYK